MPNARPDVMPLVCTWFQKRGKVGIKSILDIGCGFGKWGFLARLYLQAWNPMYIKDYQDWKKKLRVDAIEIFEGYITDLQRLIYNNIYIGDMRTLIKEVREYDLIIMGDVLEHVSLEDGLKLLKRAREKAKRLIVSMPDYFRENNPIMGNTAEIHRHIWEDDEFPDNPKIVHKKNQRVVYYE